MSRMADVVTPLIAAPVPVLLLDTCAFLDIIRAPVRRDPNWIEKEANSRTARSSRNVWNCAGVCGRAGLLRNASSALQTAPTSARPAITRTRTWLANSGPSG